MVDCSDCSSLIVPSNAARSIHGLAAVHPGVFLTPYHCEDLLLLPEAVRSLPAARAALSLSHPLPAKLGHTPVPLDQYLKRRAVCRATP